MATRACRSCGTTVPPGATSCAECGIADPIADPVVAEGRPGSPEVPPASAPVAEQSTGGRLRSAAKTIGCLVIAGIVLLIAVMLGLLDFLF